MLRRFISPFLSKYGPRNSPKYLFGEVTARQTLGGASSITASGPCEPISRRYPALRRALPGGDGTPPAVAFCALATHGDPRALRGGSKQLKYR